MWLDPYGGDIHLGDVPPCIDAGTNDAPNLPPHDYEGGDRIVDGHGDGTAIVDMGIDEFLPLYTMRVGGIEGFFSFDYLGRPRLRIQVYVEDQGLKALSYVLVEAAITVPRGGPFVRRARRSLVGRRGSAGAVTRARRGRCAWRSWRGRRIRVCRTTMW